MPSKTLKQSLKRTFSPNASTTRQQQQPSAVLDGRMSFSSDCSTLMNVDLPTYESLKFQQPIPVVAEDDMLDPEDMAWGPPPPMRLQNWTLPMFSRKKSSRS
ncbi:hypothetical protein BDQ17DRAFT_1538066 [Cyathus striatus]|nr:hypothetical protein BDQ17DRAFT_1538066 [Cyathus striatus]